MHLQSFRNKYFQDIFYPHDDFIINLYYEPYDPGPETFFKWQEFWVNLPDSTDVAAATH